jgi:hypothetical protein
VHENGLVFVDVLKDLKTILGTNTNFMLAPWLEAPKAIATNEEVRFWIMEANSGLVWWRIIIFQGGKCSLKPSRLAC